MLIECVLGALGLAIDQAASGHAPNNSSQLQDKSARLKRVLQRRLASLVKLRRHIEASRNRLASALDFQKVQRLQAALARREQVYQERANALRRGRRKLAQLHKDLRLLNG